MAIGTFCEEFKFSFDEGLKILSESAEKFFEENDLEIWYNKNV